MNTLEIVPIGHRIRATVSVPGSKSATNRALLLAALADGTSTIRGALRSDDSARMLDGLAQLGVRFEVSADEQAGNFVLTVEGTNGLKNVGGGAPGLKPRGPAPGQLVGPPGFSPGAPAQAVVDAESSADVVLHVGNAGTAARFLTAAATLAHGRFVVDGDARMRERPIGDLVDALRALGSDVSCDGGSPPVRIHADGLHGGRAVVSGTVSSQFLSALLMVAPCAAEPVVIELSSALSSRPYVDLTLAMMRDFGVQVARDGDRIFAVEPGQYRALPRYSIEPDASSASYPYAAGAVVGGEVIVNGITNACRQGDAGFVHLLQRMGCTVDSTPAGTRVTGHNRLRGIEVDLQDMPDVAPTLAAIAPFAGSPTTISGIESARRKESDRVAALCSELTRMGVHVVEHRDGLTVHPCRTFRPAMVRTYNDHRLAMAFAVVGLRVPGIRIENPACVSKSFPGYFDIIEELSRC